MAIMNASVSTYAAKVLQGIFDALSARIVKRECIREAGVACLGWEFEGSILRVGFVEWTTLATDLCVNERNLAARRCA